ncbi:hypothetical protein N0V90_012353 [Kalmusia sp. IMI 367209]|nr:hypothetical protein N0V90_012353 [Kalmusia sp. IMI 367209]
MLRSTRSILPAQVIPDLEKNHVENDEQLDHWVPFPTSTVEATLESGPLPAIRQRSQTHFRDHRDHDHHHDHHHYRQPKCLSETHAHPSSALTPLTAPAALPADKTCPICSDEYTPTATTHAAVRLPCGHFFGHACITKWLSLPNTCTCPYCRAKFFQLDPFEEARLARRRRHGEEDDDDDDDEHGYESGDESSDPDEGEDEDSYWDSDAWDDDDFDVDDGPAPGESLEAWVQGVDDWGNVYFVRRLLRSAQ